jgi:L-2-hydroxyglutarate oxidase LhgO
VLATSREGYRLGDFNLRDTAEIAGYAGFWRFLFRHRAQAWEELGRSLSKARFCAALQALVPELTEDDLEPGGSGVRAQAMRPNGDLIADFELARGDHALHVLNAPSPAATASLAIGRHIAQALINGA